ncbi:aminotransferase class V-fold PLP-dependent enzyme [Gloeobacter violaceus]|uniref:L-cysteine/cystine lyase n=1 Tax=Gloeobacter violaceus (strain ATCC 29082 / PCC 7421) TaxID=251221 RepID=Q7NED0_GLOVI|nr:aminotransferase class V-fold PLP-dependent enzyme [Gloeobacter violaceus]BAC91891.1 L-cysteine/cystine lyase [Gloeobacter violaceus PCC 7421]
MLQALRAQLDLDGRVYFNHGGQGLLPESSLERLIWCYRHWRRCGPFSQQAERLAAEQVQRTREALATQLGVAGSTLSWAESTSHSLNIALWGLDWRPGDGLLVSDCEHPGALAPACRVAERFGLQRQSVALSPAADPLAAVEAALQPNTRLVLLSHVLWNSGRVLPVDQMTRLCRERGVLVLWDGAQGAGVLPLDYSQVDLYASTCHKWWMGPAGTGFLYVSERVRPRLQPTYVGWRSAERYWPDPVWYPDGRAFEVATIPVELLAALEQSLALHAQAGSADLRARAIRDLAGQLWERLKADPQVELLAEQPPEAGLVCWRPKRALTFADLRSRVQWLEARGIFVRAIPQPLCLRASVHYFNTTGEIAALLEALERLD